MFTHISLSYIFLVCFSVCKTKQRRRWTHTCTMAAAEAAAELESAVGTTGVAAEAAAELNNGGCSEGGSRA